MPELRSLKRLALEVIIRNISQLTDIGDVPYEIIRPVLLKIENPTQLQHLSEACPQLYGPDEELWKAFIKRDIPKWEKKILYPKNPKSWWKVYRKLQREHEAEVKEDTAKLEAAFNGIKTEKGRHQSRVMEGVPHIPKLDGMQYAHAAEYNRIKKPLKDTRPTSAVLSFRSGSKTKVLTGKGVMAKARREAIELNRFKTSHKLSTPMHQLNTFATPVRKAPPGLIDDFRRAAVPQPVDPTIPKPAIFVPPKSRFTRREMPETAGVMSAEERERRLRAAKARQTTSSTIPVNNSTPSTSSSLPSSISKLPSDANQARVPTSATSQKRKPEPLILSQSVEAVDSTKLGSPIQTPPISPRYNIPKFKSSSPENPVVRVMKKKSAPSCFVPAKKRRLF
ncbi:MAG: hypothetical protein Q9220_000650 [cf. Caloplaca sp. 1 TL-2023]